MKQCLHNDAAICVVWIIMFFPWNLISCNKSYKKRNYNERFSLKATLNDTIHGYCPLCNQQLNLISLNDIDVRLSCFNTYKTNVKTNGTYDSIVQHTWPIIDSYLFLTIKTVTVKNTNNFRTNNVLSIR